MKSNWDRVLDEDHPWPLNQYTENFCNWLRAVGNIPQTMIDAGPGVANSEAWIFRDNFKDMEIIGLEPQTERYNFLESIFPGTLKKVAIASYPGHIDGWMGHLNGTSDFNLTNKNTVANERIKQRVECESIDNMIFENNMNEVFVWADIEGAELEMLKGSVKSMMAHRIIAISLELNFDRDALQVIEFLARFDFYPLFSSSGHSFGRALGEDLLIITTQVIPDDGHVQCDMIFVRLPPGCPLGNQYFQINDERQKQ